MTTSDYDDGVNRAPLIDSTDFDDLRADFLRAEREALDRFCDRYRLGCTCGHCTPGGQA